MKKSQIIHAKIARVSDILEQVEELNKMIELHRTDSENESMLSQYQYIRTEFVEELHKILDDFKIRIKAA